MTVISLIKDDACGEPNFRCRVIGKIGGNFGNGKQGFPSTDFPFGGLLGCIRGNIGNGAAAAKIAKKHRVFAAADEGFAAAMVAAKGSF